MPNIFFCHDFLELESWTSRVTEDNQSTQEFEMIQVSEIRTIQSSRASRVIPEIVGLIRNTDGWRNFYNTWEVNQAWGFNWRSNRSKIHHWPFFHKLSVGYKPNDNHLRPGPKQFVFLGNLDDLIIAFVLSHGWGAFSFGPLPGYLTRTFQRYQRGLIF